MSGLKKLELVAYKDNGFSSKTGSFSMAINPKSFNHSYEMVYNEQKILGKAATSLMFERVGVESVTLSEVIIDTTGAVPLTGANKGLTADKIIDNLKNVVYKYISNTHAPAYILLKWGTFAFQCMLTGLKVDYQMFQPDGTPLRAKLDLTFKGFSSPSSESNSANRNSPDLTHIITVKYGDTLPLLCQQIYNDASYYLKIAELNNITNIRNIPEGTKLHFPPIK